MTKPAPPPERMPSELKPAATKKFFRFGASPIKIIVVGRKGFRTAEEQLDARLEKAGYAAHRLFDVRIHPIPVGGYVAEAKILGYPVRPPGFRLRLEQTHHDFAGLLADVGGIAGISQNGQHRMHTGHRFGDQIVVLSRLQRHVDSRQAAHRACPHAGAVDDEFCLHVAARRCERRRRGPRA